MLEKILTTAGAIGGIIATCAIPIVVAWINNRSKVTPDPVQPTFGMAVNADAERADRATEALLAELRESRDFAVDRAEAAEAREASLRAELDHLRKDPTA